MKKMLTKVELGQLLQLSPRSIDRRIAAGELPRGIRLGGAVRWDADSIEKFIAALSTDSRSVDSARPEINEVAQ